MRSSLLSVCLSILFSGVWAYGQQPPTAFGANGVISPPTTATTPAPTEPVKKGRLEGKVVHLQTGEPLRKATIRLQPMRPSPGMPFEQNMRSVTSNDQGAFVFENVAAGSYMLFAERQGFVRQTYGARSGTNNGMQTVTVTADQTTSGLLFRLMPQAVVTGRVLDEEGEPLEHVQVMLMRPMYRMGKRQMAPNNYGSTNDQGAFRIAGVAPGKYYLRAERPQQGPYNMTAEQGVDNPDKPQTMFAATYYPNAAALESATALDIKPGQDLPGMDIRLRKDTAYRVSGKVVGMAPGPAQIMLQPKGNGNLLGGFGRNGSPVQNGEFTLRNVLPGSYYLVLLQGQGRMGPSSRTELEVTNRNVEGLSVIVTPPVQLTGTVRIDGDEKAQLAAGPANMPQGFPGGESAQETGTRSNLTVMLMPNDAMAMGTPTARPSTNGSFTMKDVPPMNYQVTVMQPDQSLYVKSVLYNGQEVGEAGLNLASGGGTMEIVLRRGAGQITGVVQGADGKPMQGAIVSIVPEPQQPQLNALYRQVNTDQTGSFRAAGLRPGKYKVHAWEQLENGATQDPTFLEPYKGKGTEVTLEEKGAPAITLSVISAAEMVP